MMCSMRRGIASCVVVFFVSSALPAGAAPTFSQKPVAKKTSHGRVQIAFAVSEPTDVAVSIEDAQGRVVRHLVAGVLGANPPPPLAPNSLSQTIEWDGQADYGAPAGAGPFRVRVALGVGVKYDQVLVRDELAFNKIKGLAVAPDGTVYVLDSCGGAVWSGEQIIALDRDGKYNRGVLPFPAGLPLKDVEPLGGIELRGQVAPLVQSHRLKLFAGSYAPRKTGMAVTSDGRAVLRLTGSFSDHDPERISVVGADGTARWPDPAGPQLLSRTWPATSDDKYRGYFGDGSVLALSTDGRWAYTAGHTAGKGAYPAVFRTPLPERGDAQVFFGNPEKSGTGETLLGGAPRGLAVDGQGHLLISDAANDRVLVVKEADAGYVAEFAVRDPGPLAVDRKTGAVYLASGSSVVTVTKFSGWKEAKEIAKSAFRCDGNKTFVMALDAAAPRPLVWIGTDGGTLLRIEDQGPQFGEVETVSSQSGATGSFLDLYVDRCRPEREIYWRASYEYWSRYNEATGAVEKLDTSAVAIRNGGGAGAQLMPGPDDTLYALRYPYHLLKFDRQLSPLGFSEAGYPSTWIGKTGIVEPVQKGPKHGMFMTANMTEMKHTLGVRRDGDIFVFHPLHFGGRPPKALHQYAPTGKKLTVDPIIWKVSDGCVGPRFDPQGNIYVAEIVNPGQRPYPEEFEQRFGPVKMSATRPTGVQDEIANMYGSIVKFSPRGGMFHLPGEDPFEGEPKLDGLKTVEAAYYANSMQSPVKVTGAEWIAFGYSHVETNACVCETTRFDVDEFGRVWFPDLCLYQVRVVDTAGNPLLRFGHYGNADSRGPDSPVFDAATGRLRPAKPGEARPLAEPEIAFSWLVGVAATDKYVYTGDSIARRMLRLKMTYAAEESCAVE